jgi:Endonuclease NucS C-terminal domain
MKETTFKGVKLTDERILAEMRRFDAEFRDKFTAWGVWAIERDGKYYPPKKLLSMATGIDVDEFNGGEATNSKFRELGFTVVRRSGAPEAEEEIEEAVETSLSLERDLENFLVTDLGQLESGLQLVQIDGKSGRQFDTGDAGRMDLLCVDQNQDFVVLELKAGEADDKVCSQILKYMGWLKQNLAKDRGVRGIIIANDFSEKLKYAVMPVPAITLKKYDVRFEFTSLPASSNS